MSDQTITFLLLAAVVVLFVLDRFPVAVVAVATALSLWATGVLDLNQALAGFGDPAVLFIASLFVVSESLDATGITAWAGQELIARVGDSRTRLLVLTLSLVAVLTALISVNGGVAALLPVTVVLALRLRRSPSQLLLPVAFAAHAGSLLTLSGSPVNVIASEFADDAGAGSFGYFSFALVGLPLVVGTIAFVVFFGERLLPHRPGPLRLPRLQRARTHPGRAVRPRRRRGAVDAAVGRCRDRDPAPLAARRGQGLPRDGDGERRPGRARRPAQR